MSRLTAAEQAYFNKLFIKNGVDISGFYTTHQFDDFCEPIIGFRPSRKYGQSFNAGSFQELLRLEDATICIPLLDEFLDFCIVSDRFFSPFKEDLISKCREIISKYKTIKGMQHLEVKFNSDYIDTSQREMYENVIKNPTEAIGQAKELIESCCKTILEEEKIKVNKDWDINRLVDETLKLLELTPKQVDSQDEGSENIKKLLGNLKSIPNYLGSLRNTHGSGHGKSKNFKSLDQRHAKLAVGASLTFVGFVWETYNQDKN